ncbi:endolytic transglycosylase MltG [Bacteroidia bacterium]|nr:endolytic transglycosylase MltG [Bacteroidia bacterium]MDC1394983.1 endolytic transglycosylase MltG [Bacteroidia bacterium]
MNKKQRKYIGVLLVLGLLAALATYFVLFLGNTKSSDGEYFYVRHDDSYAELRQNLIDSKIVENIATFDLVAGQMNLANTYKAGRYKIGKGVSNVNLIRKIRSGKWKKVVIKLMPEMTRDGVLEYLAENLEAEKSALQKAMNAEWVTSSGFTDENKWSIFLPDHYHFNWATSADKAITRFVDEYNKFWTTARKKKAKYQGLTTKEACVLASIVDGEAIHVDEMSMIAGLYLNRLNKGQLLQADPTILYVVGREGRRRVLNKDLKREDPYNTYLNGGLPPGPIFLPDKRAINAVINPKTHNYIFMCAKPDGSYRHNFTASMAEHNRNAAAYRRSLNRQGVMR